MSDQSVRKGRAGFPATTVRGGTERVTMAPAPTTQPAPSVTPFKMIARLPIHTLSSIDTIPDIPADWWRNSGASAWPSESMIKTASPMRQSAPMLTPAEANTWTLLLKCVREPTLMITPGPA